jgi:MtN3 and saliva related transmembrane protein
MVTQLIGWFSSVILLLTIGQQVWKQWNDRSTKGISRWLFLGQMAASTGFAIYSWLQRDWVFVTTNTLMLLSGLAGALIWLRNRRRR